LGIIYLVEVNIKIDLIEAVIVVILDSNVGLYDYEQ